MKQIGLTPKERAKLISDGIIGYLTPFEIEERMRNNTNRPPREHPVSTREVERWRSNGKCSYEKYITTQEIAAKYGFSTISQVGHRLKTTRGVQPVGEGVYIRSEVEAAMSDYKPYAKGGAK